MKQALRPFLDEALGTTTQLHTRVRRQAEIDAVEEHEELHEFLRRLEPVLYAHAEQLRESLERLSSPKPAVRTALKSLFGEAEALRDRLRGERVSADLGDDAAGLAFATATIVRLYAAASALGDPQTADIARSQIVELAAAATELASLAPAVVLRELAASGVAVEEDLAGRASSAVAAALRESFGSRLGHGRPAWSPLSNGG